MVGKQIIGNIQEFVIPIRIRQTLPAPGGLHVVFFFLRLIDWLVPDVPGSLELTIKRERYLAKQALADNQEVLLTVSRESASPGQCARSRRARVSPCPSVKQTRASE
ncbi:Anoctamin-7 [Chelonia mydas]|uniref:Anoctamin-7 n=1 Tax=Chelonia mydas TaxID=8469 RepID=M7BF53_CHEMY|nr:Anoctamin-7 [Chelonia mydas]